MTFFLPIRYDKKLNFMKKYFILATAIISTTLLKAQNIQLVKDINTIPEKGSEIRGLSISNGKIFFKAEDDTSEVEVWSSDGTASGCTNISYQPNPTDRSIRDEAHQFYELNGDTYFVDF